MTEMKSTGILASALLIFLFVSAGRAGVCTELDPDPDELSNEWQPEIGPYADIILCESGVIAVVYEGPSRPRSGPIGRWKAEKRRLVLDVQENPTVAAGVYEYRVEGDRFLRLTDQSGRTKVWRTSQTIRHKN